MTRQQKGIKT